MELKCHKIGDLEEVGLDMNARVYCKDGLSPAIRTFCGGGQETKIIEIYGIE